MYFVSGNPVLISNDVCGTIIGIYNNYLYSAYSSTDELAIYRRKLIDTGDFEFIWTYKINNKSTCACNNGISAAYGIVGDEIFIATYGSKPNVDLKRFHIFSINLITNDFIEYKTNKMPADFSNSLCNKCCFTYIISNPMDSSEIIITPWSREPQPRYSVHTGSLIDCFQIKLKVDSKKKTCLIKESIGLVIGGDFILSNIGLMEFGKTIHFHDGDLVIAGTERESERILKTDANFDLKEYSYAGFYSNSSELYCLIFEEIRDIEGFYECKVDLYTVIMDEEKLLAKFTHKTEIPNFPSTFDPRFASFILNSRMLICLYENYIYTFVFGMLSLSETSFIAASNFSNALSKTHCINEITTMDYTQNKLKQILQLPSSYEIVHELVEEDDC